MWSPTSQKKKKKNPRVIPNFRFGTGRTLTSRPQRRKNMERKKTRTEGRKEVPATNIIDHDFYSEYSLRSVFLIEV